MQFCFQSCNFILSFVISILLIILMSLDLIILVFSLSLQLVFQILNGSLVLLIPMQELLNFIVLKQQFILQLLYVDQLLTVELLNLLILHFKDISLAETQILMFCLLLQSSYLHKQLIVLQDKRSIFAENLSQLCFCYFNNFYFLFVLQNVCFQMCAFLFECL